MEIETTVNMLAQTKVTDAEGVEQVVATYTAGYKSRKRVSINMELAAGYNKAQHEAAVRADLRTFMQAVWEACGEADIPVPAGV